MERKHPSVSTDGDGTWYPQACRFLRLSHHNHSPFEKSVIERTCNTPRIEQKALMTTFHAGLRIVN
jgi:hypothetical protein